MSWAVARSALLLAADILSKPPDHAPCRSKIDGRAKLWLGSRIALP